MTRSLRLRLSGGADRLGGGDKTEEEEEEEEEEKEDPRRAHHKFKLTSVRLCAV